MAIVAFSVAADGSLTQTRYAFFDTELTDAIEGIDNRRDEPDDVSFQWIAPLDYEEGHPFAEDLHADTLWDPAEILTSLAWFSKLGAAGEVATMHPRVNYSAEEFRREFNHSLDQLRAFCSAAADNGERIGLFVVP